MKHKPMRPPLGGSGGLGNNMISADEGRTGKNHKPGRAVKIPDAFLNWDERRTIRFEIERREQAKAKKKWRDDRDDRRNLEWLRREDAKSLIADFQFEHRDEIDKAQKEEAERQEEERSERKASTARKSASFVRGEGWRDFGQDHHDRAEREHAERRRRQAELLDLEQVCDECQEWEESCSRLKRRRRG